MDRIFDTVISLSINSIWLIIFVMAVRFIFKKIPAIFMYFMWVIVFISLVFPFSFKIPYNNENSKIYNISTEYFNINSDDIYKDTENSQKEQVSIYTIIWAGTFSLMAILSVLKFYDIKDKLKYSSETEDGVIYKSENIDVPFVIGFINPKIYIPNSIKDDEKEYIILHERIHIKHKDNIIKIIAYIILLIHWFNPLVWIGYNMFSEDIERLCDESVIKVMGGKIKKNYSMSLLKLSSDKRDFDIVKTAFGEKSTKRRIYNILNYKKPTFTALIISVFMMTIVALGAFTEIKAVNSMPGFTKISCEIPFDNSFSHDKYNFKVSFPDYISEYLELEYVGGDYPMCLVRFEKGDKTANIGSFSFFDYETYDSMNPQEMPVPTEILRKDNIVITFTGPQDTVFEIGTEEANLVEKYHSELGEIINSVEFEK